MKEPGGAAGLSSVAGWAGLSKEAQTTAVLAISR